MENKKEKVGIITLGCSKNTVDSERLMGQLKLNNIELVSDPNSADCVIINTCGFIDAAKEESVNTILEAAELKKSGNIKRVIVAGCLSERYSFDLKKEIPEVDAFFGTEDYEGILKELGADLKRELLGERELTSPKHYAYLKISEGCDNPCSFCAIPLMRGKHKSKPFEDLISEATSLARKGVKELIIIGQDTTDYGIDIYGKRILAKLLNELSEIKGIEWIRLLYAYPSHFPNDVIEVIAKNSKICKYIDMPLQHITDRVLKSMRRGISSKRTKSVIKELKEKIPGLTLRTTFIVGYPAETEADFNELCEFVKEVEFDRLGVFNYSIEENTPSFILADPFDEEEKERRKSVLMEIQKEISHSKNQRMVGEELKVILDGEEGDYYIARSEKDAPEVDGEILIEKKGSVLQLGEFYRVKILDCNEYDLFAKLASN
ncbi:MAG: 30S ribosomal protein S12 methylthiotransferase RimO [Bacteroidetes bacterium]|nr:30S ribosomal protein S12 methylthiotransferase RimO [Bacteroidota bacterium]